MVILDGLINEEKVKITGKIFRGNFTTATSIFNHPKTTLGLSTFYWVLIGAVSGGVLIIAIIAGICGYKLHNRCSGSLTSKQPSGGSTFVHNNIQINPDARFKFGSFKRKKNNSIKMEELPSQPEEVKDTERIMTLGEQRAL